MRIIGSYLYKSINSSECDIGHRSHKLPSPKRFTKKIIIFFKWTDNYFSLTNEGHFWFQIPAMSQVTEIRLGEKRCTAMSRELIEDVST
jgi:hypothetical protein